MNGWLKITFKLIQLKWIRINHIRQYPFQSSFRFPSHSLSLTHSVSTVFFILDLVCLFVMWSTTHHYARNWIVPYCLPFVWLSMCVQLRVQQTCYCRQPEGKKSFFFFFPLWIQIIAFVIVPLNNLPVVMWEPYCSHSLPPWQWSSHNVHTHIAQYILNWKYVGN